MISVFGAASPTAVRDRVMKARRVKQSAAFMGDVTADAGISIFNNKERKR